MRHVLLSLVCLAIASAVTAQGKTEHLDGYAEWRQGTEIIVDGQRVRSTAATKFKGSGDAKDFAAIPLGYEVEVTGTRRSDGVVEARTVEARPNGWRCSRPRFCWTSDGRRLPCSTPVSFRRPAASSSADARAGRRPREADRSPPDSAIQVEGRLSFLRRRRSRVERVRSGQWHDPSSTRGCLRDLDDDELALVLGHELVHATHEHTRKERKRHSPRVLVRSRRGWRRPRQPVEVAGPRP